MNFYFIPISRITGAIIEIQSSIRYVIFRPMAWFTSRSSTIEYDDIIA